MLIPWSGLGLRRLGDRLAVFRLQRTVLAAAAISSVPIEAISDRGTRILVHATGVGAPFSDSTVTTASPIPSDVSADSRSYTSVLG